MPDPVESPTGPRKRLDLPASGARVLLHSCCAPCSGEVMEAMTASGIDYSIFFYNPNIHPRAEYELRKTENIRFAEQHGIEFIDADYDIRSWFERAKGMEHEPERGIRCTMCFDMRSSAPPNTRMSTAWRSSPAASAFHAGRTWSRSTAAASAPRPATPA